MDITPQQISISKPFFVKQHETLSEKRFAYRAGCAAVSF